MLRLKDIIEKSRHLTNDNFALFVDGILRIQECNREEFNNYMIKYNATNILDIAESIYFNKVYVYTDIKNKSVKEYINEVCGMNRKDIYAGIAKVCDVLELTLQGNILNSTIIDYKGKPIGYYKIIDNEICFYKNDNLITVVDKNEMDIMLIQISSAVTNLYNISNGSIS